MVGVKLRRPEQRITSVGSQKAAGGGGGDVLPLKPVGGCRRTSRGLVSVSGWLNWVVVDWRGSLLMKVISGQNRDKCLLWSNWAVRGEKAGVQVV